MSTISESSSSCFAASCSLAASPHQLASCFSDDDSDSESEQETCPGTPCVQLADADACLGDTFALIEMQESRIAELEEQLLTSQGTVEILALDVVSGTLSIEILYEHSESQSRELSDLALRLETREEIICDRADELSSLQSQVLELQALLAIATLKKSARSDIEVTAARKELDAEIAAIILDYLTEGIVKTLPIADQELCRAFCPTYGSIQKLLLRESISYPLAGSLLRHLREGLLIATSTLSISSRFLAGYCLSTRRNFLEAGSVGQDKLAPTPAEIATFIMAAGRQGLWSAEESEEFIERIVV
ncbi:hypothetical protein RQP46_008273 [Phenoliferia psychrophenolica]